MYPIIMELHQLEFCYSKFFKECLWITLKQFVYLRPGAAITSESFRTSDYNWPYFTQWRSKPLRFVVSLLQCKIYIKFLVNVRITYMYKSYSNMYVTIYTSRIVWKLSFDTKFCTCIMEELEVGIDSPANFYVVQYLFNSRYKPPFQARRKFPFFCVVFRPSPSYKNRRFFCIDGKCQMEVAIRF